MIAPVAVRKILFFQVPIRLRCDRIATNRVIYWSAVLAIPDIIWFSISYNARNANIREKNLISLATYRSVSPAVAMDILRKVDDRPGRRVTLSGEWIRQ